MKFLNKKADGFYITIAALIAALLGILFFHMLTAESFESSEQPAAVTAVFCVLTAWKDIFKVFSLGAFIAATVTFFTFVSGRISYVAFYLSGDIMNTGLSVYFILSCICFFLALVFSVAAMCRPQEKESSSL